jgi:hypothetical protein
MMKCGRMGWSFCCAPEHFRFSVCLKHANFSALQNSKRDHPNSSAPVLRMTATFMNGTFASQVPRILCSKLFPLFQNPCQLPAIFGMQRVVIDFDVKPSRALSFQLGLSSSVVHCKAIVRKCFLILVVIKSAPRIFPLPDDLVCVCVCVYLLSEGGIFNAKLIFSSMYPDRPPKMKFVTNIWHPNGDDAPLPR